MVCLNGGILTNMNGAAKKKKNVRNLGNTSVCMHVQFGLKALRCLHTESEIFECVFSYPPIVGSELSKCHSNTCYRCEKRRNRTQIFFMTDESFGGSFGKFCP